MIELTHNVSLRADDGDRLTLVQLERLTELARAHGYVDNAEVKIVNTGAARLVKIVED